MNISLSRTLLRVTVLVLVLIAGSCAGPGKKGGDYEPFNEQPSDGNPVQNSGKSLSGSYSVTSSDPYAVDSGARTADKRVSFDSAGQFIRETLRDGVVTRRERGSYVIGTQGEFVLFVEEIGGELLQSARAERYKIVSQSDDEITVERSPGNQLILRRK